MSESRSIETHAPVAWPWLRRFSAREAAFAERMSARRSTAFFYEFLRFGLKEAWACLFGGVMVALLIGTHFWYPRAAPLARYDFLLVAAVVVQALMLRFGLETWEEAKVILAYHVVGTAMEIFKTAAGSWIYPEPSLVRIGGVLLFTGFMYSCIGSYLCRIWGLMHFEFRSHPPVALLAVLSFAIYINFFAHHYGPDFRWPLFGITAIMFWRTQLQFTVWRRPRAMPLLPGLSLVTAFIWLAENVVTFTKTWLYPGQLGGWSMVGIGKYGSWFLLLIISYTLVALIKQPKAVADGGGRPTAR